MRRAIVPDAHLFEASLRDVKPLRGRKRRAKPAVPPAASAPPEIVPVAKPAHRRATPSAPAAHAAPKPAAPSPPPGLDGSTERKLNRGLLPIDATLDLHGMTQDQAHTALDRFVGRHANGAARVLLIVTGKGRGGAAGEGGVLKRLMPEWLMAGPHAGRILRIASAARFHGGGGAFYVLLRRKR